MIFARHIGGDDSFTKGKTYIVTQTGTDTVNLHKATLTDDNGNVVTFNPDDDHRFEYCEQVFGVFLYEMWSGTYPGMVVLLDDISNDGLMVRCLDDEKSRYLDSHMILILDPSNFGVGFEIRDMSTGVWQRVERIDEAMWVKTQFSDKLRPLTDYSLSVAKGEIDRARLARCVNDNGIEQLTEGYQYRVLCEKDEEIEVEAGDGCVYSYDRERFEII